MFDVISHRFGGEIVVYPIADVHYGAIEHCADEWYAFCKAIAKQKHAYIILNGDLVNNSVRSCKFANPFDEAVRPREQKRKMVEMLKPLAADGRILCIVSGNHERRTTKECDQDITYDIAAKLDIEDLYRESIAYMSIRCGDRNTADHAKTSYNFVVTHGAGGGATPGAAVNRAQAFANTIDGLDCLVVGHTHKGIATKPEKVVFDARNNRVTTKHYVLISCVPWLCYAGYAAQQMLAPTHSADPQRLYLNANKNGKNIEVRW